MKMLSEEGEEDSEVEKDNYLVPCRFNSQID